MARLMPPNRGRQSGDHLWRAGVNGGARSGITTQGLRPCSPRAVRDLRASGADADSAWAPERHRSKRSMRSGTRPAGAAQRESRRSGCRPRAQSSGLPSPRAHIDHPPALHLRRAAAVRAGPARALCGLGEASPPRHWPAAISPPRSGRGAAGREPAGRRRRGGRRSGRVASISRSGLAAGCQAADSHPAAMHGQPRQPHRPRQQAQQDEPDADDHHGRRPVAGRSPRSPRAVAATPSEIAMTSSSPLPITRSGRRSSPSGMSSGREQREGHDQQPDHRNRKPVGQHAIGRDAAEVIGGGQ